MSAPWDESRVVVPFMPSLLHCASVKIAVQLHNEFGVEMLDEVLTEIWHGNSTTFEENTEENCQSNRAKGSLLFIPAHLRTKIMEAVHGLHYSAELWKKNHSHIFKFKVGKCRLKRRFDGSIDEVKTAQHLVRNEEIDIRKRFEVACSYCLEESVQTLWAKMEESGKTNDFVAVNYSSANIWIGWMRNGSRTPWMRTIPQYLDPLRRWAVWSSCFFPFLQPKDRDVFLSSLQYTTKNDFRFCMYALNKKEEEKILTAQLFRVIVLHLLWPLQSLFLETVEKTWNLIGFEIFSALLEVIAKLNQQWKGYAYCELFLDFWNKSPNHLKERAKDDPNSRKHIDSLFEQGKLMKINRQKNYVLTC